MNNIIKRVWRLKFRIISALLFTVILVAATYINVDWIKYIVYFLNITLFMIIKKYDDKINKDYFKNKSTTDAWFDYAIYAVIIVIIIIALMFIF